MGKRLNMAGKEYINKFGESFKVTSCDNRLKVNITFDNGYKTTCTSTSINSLCCSSPYLKTVLGVGYLGDGKYNYMDDRYVYKAWSHMITRCYDEKYSAKFPTYKDCYVDERFHNFQVFAEWYYSNTWIDAKHVLDKDILIKGNKVYSPDTCILVDSRINAMFTKCNSIRGEYPIGVSIDKRYNKLRGYIYTEDNKRTMRYCDTIEEAFNMYKSTKEQYLKRVADEYKNKYPNFPQKLYDAMYKYEVEITD